MSPFGPKRIFHFALQMSAFGAKADINPLQPTSPSSATRRKQEPPAIPQQPNYFQSRCRSRRAGKLRAEVMKEPAANRLRHPPVMVSTHVCFWTSVSVDSRAEIFISSRLEKQTCSRSRPELLEPFSAQATQSTCFVCFRRSLIAPNLKLSRQRVEDTTQSAQRLLWLRGAHEAIVEGKDRETRPAR
jgi:hypothetical protein